MNTILVAVLYLLVQTPDGNSHTLKYTEPYPTTQACLEAVKTKADVLVKDNLTVKAYACVPTYVAKTISI